MRCPERSRCGAFISAVVPKSGFRTQRRTIHSDVACRDTGIAAVVHDAVHLGASDNICVHVVVPLNAPINQKTQGATTRGGPEKYVPECRRAGTTSRKRDAKREDAHRPCDSVDVEGQREQSFLCKTLLRKPTVLAEDRKERTGALAAQSVLDGSQNRKIE